MTLKLKRTKITLGTRIYGERHVTDVAEARYVFLHQIPEHAPEALQNLASLVGPIHERRNDTSAAVARWGAKFYLTRDGAVPDWVSEQVSAALDEWSAHPRRAGKLWSVVGELPSLSEETQKRERKLIAARLEPVLKARRHGKHEPALFIPGLRGADESNKAFLHRLRKDAAVVGLHRPSTATLEHFQWAAQFQCAALRITEIDAGAKRRDIEKAVNKVLRLVGLDRRREQAGPVRRA